MSGGSTGRTASPTVCCILGKRDEPDAERRAVVERIVSLKEVTHRVPYSEKHIRRLSKAGLFPPILRVGQHRVGILESALDEWIANRMPASR